MLKLGVCFGRAVLRPRIPLARAPLTRIPALVVEYAREHGEPGPLPLPFASPLFVGTSRLAVAPGAIKRDAFEHRPEIRIFEGQKSGAAQTFLAAKRVDDRLPFKRDIELEQMVADVGHHRSPAVFEKRLNARVLIK